MEPLGISPKGIGAVPTGTVQSLDLGPDASKPQPGTPGRLWFSTDVGLLYVDTGQAWQVIAISHFSQVLDKGTGEVANSDVFCLSKFAAGAQFSAYPLVPGVDTQHDTAQGVGALAANQGLVSGEIVKSGVATGISIAATGVVTDTVSFTVGFPTALDNVLLTLANPSAAGAAFGGLWWSNGGVDGFTINLNVTTAVSGATISVAWLALGH